MKLAMAPYRRRSSKSLQEVPSNADFERQQSNGSLRIDPGPINIEVRENNTKIVDWIVLITPICYTLVILFLISWIYITTPQIRYPYIAHNILQRAHKIQSMYPIIDIIEFSQFSYHIRGCPPDFEEATLGIWEGIENGNVCDRSNKNCESVQSMEAQRLRFWKQKLYCIKYDKTAQWRNGNQCQKQYKACSSYICVKQQLQCPITDLQSIHQQGDIQFGKNQYRIVRDERQTPLLFFNISASSTCLNLNDQPQFKSKEYYPLSKYPESGCDQFGDYTSITNSLDSGMVLEILKENDILFEQLPHFEEYVQNTDEYQLQALRSIKLNEMVQCNKLNTEIFNNSSKKSFRITRIMRRNNLPLITGCVILILFSIVTIKFHNNKYLTFINKRITMIVNIGAAIIMIVTLIYSSFFLYDVLASNGLKQINDNLDVFIQNQCINIKGILMALDQIHQYSFKIYNSNLSLIYAAFIGSIIYLIVQSLLYIIQYISSNTQVICQNPWSSRVNYEIRY
ncbi:unnamed protein product [Paramecium octaurelia]|uniref:Transmembrane protein n=1 Tax=Paramecium octaurelia TaxID=43137 RepID=A0A8S1TZ37_PAROT|nr:unnamed protein product [Paramecium octaurelia]